MIHLRNRSLRALSVLRTALFALAGVLPLLSCSEGVTGPSDLVGGAWRLQSMQLVGGEVFVPDDPSRFTITFEADDHITVVADCNRCGGSYALSGVTLTVPAMACTLAACPTPRGEEFAALVDGSSTLAADALGRLSIESPEGRLLLVR